MSWVKKVDEKGRREGETEVTWVKGGRECGVEGEVAEVMRIGERRRGKKQV